MERCDETLAQRLRAQRALFVRRAVSRAKLLALALRNDAARASQYLVPLRRLRDDAAARNWGSQTSWAVSESVAT